MLLQQLILPKAKTPWIRIAVGDSDLDHLPTPILSCKLIIKLENHFVLSEPAATTRANSYFCIFCFKNDQLYLLAGCGSNQLLWELLTSWSIWKSVSLVCKILPPSRKKPSFWNKRHFLKYHLLLWLKKINNFPFFNLWLFCSELFSWFSCFLYNVCYFLFLKITNCKWAKLFRMRREEERGAVFLVSPCYINARELLVFTKIRPFYFQQRYWRIVDNAHIFFLYFALFLLYGIISQMFVSIYVPVFSWTWPCLSWTNGLGVRLLTNVASPYAVFPETGKLFLSSDGQPKTIRFLMFSCLSRRAVV